MIAFSKPRFPPPPRRGNGQNELNTARPAPYLRVPERLLRVYAHDPLAVGVYLAVARCGIAQQVPVPLSSADLAAWAGAPHRRDINIARRIRRLSDDGWLIAEPGRAVKPRLQPVWSPEAPWRFDSAQQGKPGSVRTIRVPLELFDSYLGRLEPRPGRTPALITRYFDRPLLDLAELGSYALALAGYTKPTPWLCQLKLAQGGHLLAPQVLADLLKQAHAGTLQLVADDPTSAVTLSVAGWRRLGYDALPPGLDARNGSLNGSPSGSNSAPQRITQAAQHELPFAASECDSAVINVVVDANAWDSRNERSESTNPPPQESSGMGDGGDTPASSAASDPPATVRQDLDPALRTGHAALNAARPIRPGEWLELLQLQRDYGAEQLLVWQARAGRAERVAGRGISPEYYVMCAAGETSARITQRTWMPQRSASAATEVEPPPPAPCSSVRADVRPPVTAQLDPACDALLRAMGVRQRARLSGVPLELITAWHAVVEHPGLTARFTDPVAFAVSQLAAHTPPPSQAELERWATWQPRHAGNTPLPLIAPNDPASSGEHSAWENHARRLLPGASSDAIRHLASFLAQGASDDEALALLADQQAYEAQVARGEVLV